MSRKLLLLISVAVFAVGCQPGLIEKDFVGNWTSKVMIPDAELLKQIKAMGGTEKDLATAKSMLSGMSVTLDLKADKGYAMGQGAGGNLDGKWAFADKKITLTPEKFMGMSKDEFLKKAPTAAEQTKPIVLTADEKGTTLTGTGPQGVSFSFTKAEAKTEEKK